MLVVGGGSSAEQTVPGLADLLPVEVGDLQANVTLAPLGEVLPAIPAPPINEIATTVNSVNLRAGARTLIEPGLLTAWSYGSGQVYFAAFDLSILRAWPDEPFLWEQVLVINTPLAPAATLRWQGNNMLSNVLQLPELGLPPFGILLLYIVGYIMLIGPINFLVLRRRGRSELAWITIPVLVLVFVLGTYSVGVLIRGVRAQTFQLSIVQGFEGVEHGYATSFVGVFSPRREIYDLGFPEMTLVSTWRFDTRGNDVALLWTDSNTRINDVLVDVSGIRSFAAERAVPLDVQLESNVQQQGDRVQGTVSNRGDIPLQDAFIVYNNTVQPIGDLPPGCYCPMC
ncbi:MAG: hypothetical protein HC893_11970 [Chloroflexaceae bacterium]|nr:hypothetical protein [Chloroflexaceae bacterium]